MEVIKFNSRSKFPYDMLSNFYYEELKTDEGVFGSVEHYYQALKFIKGDRIRFTVDGDLGSQSSSDWGYKVAHGRFIKSAGSKEGTIKYGLTLIPEELSRERSEKRMRYALGVKFSNPPFKDILLDTGDRLLLHTTFRGSGIWCGKIGRDGEIIGENLMGKILMDIRDKLQNS